MSGHHHTSDKSSAFTGLIIGVVALLIILQRMLRESRSIENFFVAGDDPDAPATTGW